MSQGPDLNEIERIRWERDLYRRLLELGGCEDLQPLLQDALTLAVEATGAEHGYLELYDEVPCTTPTFWIAHGFSDEELEVVRATISSGVIGKALVSGQTVHSSSALSDERFAQQPSVRTNKIRAVLCIPLGGNQAIGVLYLQRRRGIMPFNSHDIALGEEFARHVAPFVTRLLNERKQRCQSDPTAALREELSVDGLIGRSEELAAVLQYVALVAPRDLTVLITGPSGTGKTALARAIHDNSPRARGPFIELSCATLPEGLAESELFGSAAGGHSLAYRAIPGKVAAAKGGTLFLDEIGELPLALQAKLLQLLQSKIYFPFGQARPETADIRVIAATNVELEEQVRNKRFRADLLFRINVMPIRMPGLQQRVGDIPLLAIHFVQVFSDATNPPLPFSDGAVHALMTAEWPGNVRELANVVHAGLIRAQGERAPAIAAHHLFPEMAMDAVDSPDFYAQVRTFQSTLLTRVLLENNWNVSAGARQLGLARSSMNHLIRTLGLARDQQDK